MQDRGLTPAIVLLQADAAAADKGSARVEALLAAGEVTAKLKGSQAQEQQLVSGFLHHLCDQVHPFRLTLAQFPATKHSISADCAWRAAQLRLCYISSAFAVVAP